MYYISKFINHICVRICNDNSQRGHQERKIATDNSQFLNTSHELPKCVYQINALFLFYFLGGRMLCLCEQVASTCIRCIVYTILIIKKEMAKVVCKLVHYSFQKKSVRFSSINHMHLKRNNFTKFFIFIRIITKIPL